MPAKTKDLYEILGVDRNASDAEIKKAFRHKARELHPDVNDSPTAEDEFKELNEAYDVLSDANKRAPESIRYWFHLLDLNGAERVDRSCIYEFYLSQVADREWREG